MNEQQAKRIRIYLTVAVLLAEIGHLAWEHFHGGIASHHFLNRADMPAVSNGWGLLLLPAISWFLGGIALRRSIATAAAATINAPGGQAEAAGLARGVFVGFFAELLFGASLAATFSLGYQDVTSILFFGMLLLALVFRVYRAECVLGFVLGMTFTFGAILPALVASVTAVISAVAHRVLYPLARRVWMALGLG
ncbi:MAG TPA: hypothetical protein PLJ16_02210 [Casimicrobium huifangae]|jgi:hypothetical protein|uniref:hypothetical protein n=1 Tax=Casimicrobium huifangae TaxID=2591109 RepID=UPI0012ECA012|nr:hypothetical protein [Casimicrobium huifangae]HOB00290.1 hypothetical protein [Casimicrobium huifangae]HQA32262.1 hypothetical protein [Casimicrobium huifangae]HQD64011.1 hypothetical protein [Casimicrobium huifangae]